MFKPPKELPRPAAAPTPGEPGERRAARSGAALPEVSEVDWSEWESSMFHSELDTLLSGPMPLASSSTPAPNPERPESKAPVLPEVREVDWSQWEDSVRGQLEQLPTRGKPR